MFTYSEDSILPRRSAASRCATSIERLRLSLLQWGHHRLRFLTLFSDASHWCPCSHCHESLHLVFTYSTDNILPPRSVATQCAASTDNSLRVFLVQWGHHRFRFLTLFSDASHWCPCSHCHRSPPLACKYLEDNILPPRPAATRCASSIESLCLGREPAANRCTSTMST